LNKKRELVEGSRSVRGRTVLRLALATHLAILGCDSAGSVSIEKVHEQECPLQHETLEADPVPHRRETNLASVGEAEGHPKPQRVLPVGHHREFGRRIAHDERQDT